MANLNLWGKAYALSGNVTVAISVNGNDVFNGEVTTTAASTPVHAEAESIASFSVSDSVLGTTADISVSVTNGDLILMGFGNSDTPFGSSPGQLKSNVSENGEEPYNVTDEDIINEGIVPADDGTVGEFHITIADGWTITFDNEFPA